LIKLQLAGRSESEQVVVLSKLVDKTRLRRAVRRHSIGGPPLLNSLLERGEGVAKVVLSLFPVAGVRKTVPVRRLSPNGQWFNRQFCAALPQMR